MPPCRTADFCTEHAEETATIEAPSPSPHACTVQGFAVIRGQPAALILARIFHAFCVLFPAFVGGQAVSLRERASYAG